MVALQVFSGVSLQRFAAMLLSLLVWQKWNLWRRPREYHWVSEFAPPKYQRVLSYASGWLSSLGWLASVASSVFVLGVEVEAIIEVVLPNYSFANWQLSLIMIAFLLVTIVFNTYGARILPSLEIASLVGHSLGFFVVMIPLVVLCPKNSAYDVFVNFQDNSGYNNIGIAYLTSQITVIYCNLGSDSVVHISEEVEDASLIVPRCMWWSYVGNVIFGIFMLIVMLFCMGPLEAAIDSDVPYLLLFNNAGSTGLSIFLNVLLFLLIFAGNITALATCSREIWAFARDRGLPGSKWTGKMNYKLNIPENAVYLTSFLCGILTLINIGSSLAFNIIVSVSVLGLLSTYMISIGCVLWKRLTPGQSLPPARWSLGRYGIAINAFAFLYSAFIIVFACFPTGLPVDTESANWAPLVWVLVMLLAVVAYLLHGKRHYTAPVEFVEGRKAVGTELQST